MDIENRKATLLSEEMKRGIREELNIDPDSELLNPTVDYVFKRIFTADEKEAKAALIDFINSILEHEKDDRIVDLTIANPQIPVDRGKEKKSVFDIRARYNNGRQAIIEMQKDPAPGFKKRAQHIISKAYGRQEISGSGYDSLEKNYLICITCFDVIKESGEYIKDYRFRDRQGVDLSDDNTIVFLDLTKIDKVLDKQVDKMTNVEKWAVFFKYATDKSKRELLRKIIETKAGIGMAAKILMEVSKDEEARAYYESELIFELDQIGRYNQAKREGIDLGREQTEERYEAEIAKIEKTHEAEKIESVKKLIALGLTADQISAAMQMEIPHIENIKKEFDL